MKTENAILMQQARESLRGKWEIAIGVFAVYILISAVLNSIMVVGTIGSLIISGPLSLGISYFTLALARNGEAKFDQLFKGFDHFAVSMSAYLWILLYVLLWMLLFIVPGIMKALSYSMTFYIIADDNSIGAKDAMLKSERMMVGNKGKLFRLFLRFTGWFLLCILTAGIGFLWLIPYVHVSIAKFYDDLKNNQPAVL